MTINHAHLVQSFCCISGTVTSTTLWANSADDKLMIILLVFKKKKKKKKKKKGLRFLGKIRKKLFQNVI